MKKLKFYKLEEMKAYYDKETKTYNLMGEDIDINFDFKEKNARILCHNLSCLDIDANYINAWDIDACFMNTNKIIAHNIDCCDLLSKEIVIINDGEINAWGNIKSDSIKWERLTNW